MANLTVSSIRAAGVAPTYVAASPAGDKVKPGERTFIHVKNASGASVTVTLDDTGSQSPVGAIAFNPDVSIVIQPDSERFIGPLVDSRFRGADGKVAISYSATTSVTVAALRV